MAVSTESRHGMWSSRWLFVLAAAGSAVGLGNIWKFPYIAGENGGGAFVLIYLACVAFVGLPIMMAEVLIGREGRQSPINTMRALVQQHHRSPAWVLIGWMGVLAGFLILSYYTVIAGWALYYIFEMASGAMTGASGDVAASTFNDFLADPWQLLFWQTLFMAGTVFIVARGVIKGLETAIRWFMPLLFVLLFVLLGYAVTTEGFQQGWDFMFAFNWETVSGDTVLIAMGQAFFTLSLGMGAIMAYGAYVPSSASIGSTVAIIAGLDTLVAVAAGLAIFPIVFANGLEPGQGPGLMFVTIPLAFGQMPLGALFGTLFFVLVSFAAITSAISISEPALAYLVETYNAKRSRVAISLGVISWIIGIGTVLSFNLWADVHIVGERTFFDFVDHVSQNIMLPLGGMLIALFAAWGLPKTVVGSQLGLQKPWVNVVWKLLCGVVAPLGVAVVFVATLFG
ncbi:MAG: sodium-dependent transporter [Gammaproteobacteria bacterium]|nr:sodium-dependent transporter [Gammaproteobacteria bacterium]MBK81206.1 sodium-dependent transporter [Gammaproteobacteria bacterium]